jgi:DNA mismatch endonuclease, patch repair protein
MTRELRGTDAGTVSEQRSRMMRSVRGKNTRPEMTVRRAVHAAGLRYRLHVKALPGSPDLVFPSRRIVVFVHGCFWHRHPGCRLATTPKTRVAFWVDKFSRNQERDAAVALQLRAEGWDPVEVWECQVKSGEYLELLMRELRHDPHSKPTNP